LFSFQYTIHFSVGKYVSQIVLILIYLINVLEREKCIHTKHVDYLKKTPKMCFDR